MRLCGDFPIRARTMSNGRSTRDDRLKRTADGPTSTVRVGKQTSGLWDIHREYVSRLIAVTDGSRQEIEAKDWKPISALLQS
jgi:hypothetical protein